MAIDAGGEDFVLTIVDVFTLTARGTAVIGPIESGSLRTGDEVEIWDGRQLVATARAEVEMVNNRAADPRTVGLLLDGVDKALLRPGQSVRRRASGG